MLAFVSYFRINQIFKDYSAICHAHAEEIDKMPNVPIEESQQITDEAMDIDYEEDNDELESAQKKDLNASFIAFGEKAGLKGIAPALNFGGLKPATKKRKVYTIRKLVKVVTSLMAPNDNDELMRLYQESLVPNAWINSSEKKLVKVFVFFLESAF